MPTTVQLDTRNADGVNVIVQEWDDKAGKWGDGSVFPVEAGVIVNYAVTDTQRILVEHPTAERDVGIDVIPADKNRVASPSANDTMKVKTGDRHTDTSKHEGNTKKVK